MSDQQQGQQLPQIYDAQEPDEESKRLDAIFDDLEKKQPDTLDQAGKGLIERMATFLGVLFGVTVLSTNFPPAYLKGNMWAKGMVTLTLACFLGSLAAAMIGTLVRPYRRYTYNITESSKELERMIKYKMTYLRWANILFACGAISLAGLLILIVWSL